MKKEDLKKLVTSTVKEMSVTGGTATATAGTGEQYATPKAFKKIKEDAPRLASGKADISTYTNDKFTAAPSIPDRKSKMMDYKSLWEEEPVDETILTKTARELEKLRATHRDIYDKIMDKIRDYIIDAYPHDKEVEMIISKDLQAAGLNENYARFRNQNAKKNGPEQLHTAIKEIKKKLQEVDRLLEYTQRLKSEITEGSEGFKYRVHTERALEQVTETIKQLYIKNKKLK